MDEVRGFRGGKRRGSERIWPGRYYGQRPNAAAFRETARRVLVPFPFIRSARVQPQAVTRRSLLPCDNRAAARALQRKNMAPLSAFSLTSASRSTLGFANGANIREAAARGGQGRAARGVGSSVEGRRGGKFTGAMVRRGTMGDGAGGGRAGGAEIAGSAAAGGVGAAGVGSAAGGNAGTGTGTGGVAGARALRQRARGGGAQREVAAGVSASADGTERSARLPISATFYPVSTINPPLPSAPCIVYQCSPSHPPPSVPVLAPASQHTHIHTPHFRAFPPSAGSAMSIGFHAFCCFWLWTFALGKPGHPES